MYKLSKRNKVSGKTNRKKQTLSAIEVKANFTSLAPMPIVFFFDLNNVTMVIDENKSITVNGMIVE